MANYTIDDIEILRKKSGITYEEAVNLLEYHNGSLSRSLIDLEKNGRLKDEKPVSAATGNQSILKKLFNTLYHFRVLVRNNGVVVANLSSLALLITLLVAPHILIIGVIVSLFLGYRISIDRKGEAFSADNFDSIMRNAKTNMQNTFHSFSGSAGNGGEQQQPQRARTESAPTGTRPVNVQFPGAGQVDVRDEGDGYHEADIG